MDANTRRRLLPALVFAMAFVVLCTGGCGKSESKKKTAAEAPDPKTTGKLVVKSNVATAAVEVIGDSGSSAKGTAGQPLGGLAPGKYAIVVRAEGWPESRQEAVVVAGQTAEVDVPFKTGSLRVTSDPTGAAVRLGTNILGRTPLAAPQVPAGELQLSIEYPGWPAVALKTTITENQETAEAVRLPHGKLIVESSPAGAAVLLNGRSLGQTPLTIERFSAGTKKLTLQAPDFPPLVVTVKMEDQGETRISRDLGASHPVLDPATMLAAVWVETPKEDPNRLSPAFTDSTGFKSQNGIVRNLNRKKLFEQWLARKYSFEGVVKIYDREEGQVEFEEVKGDLTKHRVLAKLTPEARINKEFTALLVKGATVAMHGKLTAVEEGKRAANGITFEFSAADWLRDGLPERE